MKKFGYDAVISCICNDNTAVVSHYYYSIHFKAIFQFSSTS